MFGLQNFAGSCWVNACLQGIFRIPELMSRYTYVDSDMTANEVDKSLSKLWKSQGKDGLKEFFLTVRSATMPAGQGIGDSNELLIHLCDKLAFLDELCRFKIADHIKCLECDFCSIREDSVIEFDLHPERRMVPISECIVSAMTSEKLSDWKCDKCSKIGATKQKLIGTFPKVMIFRVTSVNTSVQYTSVLVLNSKKYYLVSVISHTGGHWFAHSREMPPGKPWFTLDDTRVRQHSPNEFPMSEMMKILIYYRIEE
jgi:ubiquitin C-terminal hydrolase